MQLAMGHQSYVRGMRPESGSRPDAVRILGYSGAIALNVCALGLLLMPLQVPLPTPVQDPRATTVVLLDLRPPPLPVTPPRQVPPRPLAPQPRIATPVVAPAVEQVVVEHGTLPAVEQVSTPLAVGPPTQARTTPAPMRLEYAVAPPPSYPRAALRAGLEGTVMLQVLVDVDGRPLAVEIAEGSGHRELDVAARRHVLAHWRFRPAMQGGVPVQAVGLVPIDFRLD